MNAFACRCLLVVFALASSLYADQAHAVLTHLGFGQQILQRVHIYRERINSERFRYRIEFRDQTGQAQTVNPRFSNDFVFDSILRVGDQG